MLEHPVKRGCTAFAYVIEGNGTCDPENERLAGVEHLVLFEDGDRVAIKSGKDGLRYLLIAGEPIGEPVAWYGHIVMNTQEELARAFQELQDGTFIKQTVS